MAIKYECCYCQGIFPAEEAVDGYNQGYKIGFLCPKCGENIQAGILAKQKLKSEQYKWTFIAFILFLPTLFTRNSDIIFGLLGFDVSLYTLFFIAWLAFMSILLISKPSLVMVTTFLTKPVNKA